MTPRLPFALALVACLLGPAPAEAQLGAIEAFARRVSDLSFYYTVGGVGASNETLQTDAGGVRAFGVELLFTVADIRRPLVGAPRPQRADSVRRVWTTMEVTRSADGVDTVYTYEIEPVPHPPAPSESLWVLEMGIGYGQLHGYDLADPSLAMNLSVRDLPAATLYASYSPWGNYFGVRTGFMRTQGLQVLDGDGATFTGDGDAFVFGGLTGYAFSMKDLWVFAETGYTIRKFPSVEWTGAGPLPTYLPRELDVSGWFVTAGLQFPFGA